MNASAILICTDNVCFNSYLDSGRWIQSYQIVPGPQMPSRLIVAGFKEEPNVTGLSDNVVVKTAPLGGGLK